MNGIFIKGASLPENCYECPCNIGIRCFVHPPEQDGVIADTVDELCEKGGKPDWCPIVEAEIDKTEPVKDWISVKDRLPENDGLYIVCKTVEGHQISFEARWKGNKWWLSVVDNNRLDYVTHWQPLPEPPKGE